MKKIFPPKKKPQTQTDKVHRVNRRAIVFFIIAPIMVALACNLSPLMAADPNAAKNSLQTEVSVALINASENETTTEQPVSKAEPISPSGQLQESGSEIKNVGTKEYAVTATDFSCICTVDGNLIQELNIKDNQLEIVNPGGPVRVYEKIGENTYKRSWMGYYIDTTGGKETKVDEERSLIIILTDTGYIMEHYSGSEGSPCCIHTFTQTE